MLASRHPINSATVSKVAARAVGATAPSYIGQKRTILGLSKAVDKQAYRFAKSLMPTISKTEQIALGCGTIGFDRDIFTGNPSLKKLVDTYQPEMSAEEQSFMDNEVNELCRLINDHDVSMTKDFTKEAWDYMRDKGFFALKIPKEWGGKGFSTLAVSRILAKLGIHSMDANATVAVPNSLGPGELLVRYGTDEQKQYFLPRLADGTLIPCFGLTAPHSGSDATSLIQSDCVVEERNGELGVVASFKKRYITLAPVAGVVGLALNLTDPKGLLKGKGEEGFTVALLERDHEGLIMGNRHMPLNAAFMNGTVEGDNVWIPMSNILGGQEKCGLGWQLFVECLAEGRGVSLPAGSNGAGCGVIGGVGAYSRIRKQFRVPIAEFGGIQEAMSLAASDSLIVASGCDLMNAIIDNHEAPMVVSSIMKQNCTERGRRVIERGMDVAAGAAICRGDNNIIGNAYMNIPIGITVEGANIMTRSFQIIGQGLTRCHPHMLEFVQCLQAPAEEEDKAVKTFTKQFYAVVNHAVVNFGRSITRGLGATFSTATRSSTAYKNGDKLLDYHEAQLLRLSANFALTSDLCFTLGGTLKFEELLMGRLADAMGAIFMGYATLHHYSRNRGIEGLEAITEHAMLRLEKEAQDAMKEAADNFPGPLGTAAGAAMKLGCFPLGSITRPYKAPSDKLSKEVSRLATTPSGVREMFTKDIYVAPEGERHQLGEMMRALPVCVEADKIASQLRREKREPTQEEADLIAKAEALRDVLVQVNVFPHVSAIEGSEGYVRPALQGTEERLASLERKTFA
eukprot:Nitzschia sp. Nitz4//scaffold10_size219509//208423//210879//NITZ4_001466-RA/size219509-augustus-gene-0.257-mRNA-1//1//CDS//3329533034//5723//frame0